MRLPTRLALIGVGALALTLVAVAALTYQLVRVGGRESVDQLLRDELAELAAGFPEPTAGADLGRLAQQYLAVHPGSERHLTAIVLGGATYTSRVGPAPLLDLRADGELPLGRAGRLETVATDEGPVRVLSAPLDAGGTTVGRAVIAAPLEEVHADAERVLGRILAAGAAGLVLGGAALVVATRRALRPVSQLAEAAQADVVARVPEPARMDEVGTLAHEFNRMVDRLAADAEHRRRLIAAVSHELRTPLAVARGHLELSGVAGAGVVQAELDRLGRIVDDLTAIVDGAAGAEVHIGAVWVPDVLEELRERVAGLGTEVAIGTAPPVVVEADQHRLAQSLLNLVLNATTHTPAGTAVHVQASRSGTEVLLEVVDDGPGIDPAVADRVFEPFVTTRADGSGSGSGLGLAVVKSLTEAQGGTVEVHSGAHGTIVRLRFPVVAGLT